MPAVPAYLWLAKYTIIVVCIKVVHVGRKENCFIGSAVLFSPFPRLYVHTYLYPQVDTARLRSPASVSRVRQHRIAIALFIYSMKMWARRTIFSIPFHYPLSVSPPGPVYPLPRLRYLCIAMYIHCNSPSNRHDDNDNLRDWPHTSSIHPPIHPQRDMYDADAGRPSLAMNNFVTKRGAPVPYTIKNTTTNPSAEAAVGTSLG